MRPSLLVLVMLFVLAGCGGSGSSTGLGPTGRPTATGSPPGAGVSVAFAWDDLLSAVQVNQAVDPAIAETNPAAWRSLYGDSVSGLRRAVDLLGSRLGLHDGDAVEFREGAVPRARVRAGHRALEAYVAANEQWMAAIDACGPVTLNCLDAALEANEAPLDRSAARAEAAVRAVEEVRGTS